jgi:hypothetical protein
LTLCGKSGKLQKLLKSLELPEMKAISIILLCLAFFPATGWAQLDSQQGKLLYSCINIFGNSLTKQFKPLETGLDVDFKFLAQQGKIVPLSTSAAIALDRFREGFIPESLKEMSPGEIRRLIDGVFAWNYPNSTWTHWTQQIYLNAQEAIDAEIQRLEKELLNVTDRATREILSNQLKNLKQLPQKMKIAFENPYRNRQNLNIPIIPQPVAPDDARNLISGGDASRLNDKILRNLIYLNAKKAVNTVFGSSAAPARLIQDIEELLIPVRQPQMSVAGSNFGIIEYLSGLLDRSPILASDALRFYSRVRQIDLSQPQSKADIILFDPKSQFNVWQLALEETDSNPFRAIRVLSIFGHDDVTQSVFSIYMNHRSWGDALNLFQPSNKSVLYQNGALDGLEASSELKEEFSALYQEGLELYRQKFGDNAKSAGEGLFRSGNYHFYGGAYLASELMARGHDRYLGVRIPEFVAELLGGLYKQITMQSVYLGPLEQKLYLAGYPRIKPPKPKGVEQWEYERALFSVRLNLLHLKLTQEQHRKGAEWWRKKISEYVANSSKQR